MDACIDAVLRDLEAFGQRHDAAESERARRMLNITRDTGELLVVLVRAMRAQRVLEVGTSNGYSTVWLAAALLEGSPPVVTLEVQGWKAELARTNLERAGLADRARIVLGDATEYLAGCADAAFEFVFLDSERSDYVRWWPDLDRLMAPGALLVVDNAVSHAAEVREFVELVRGDSRYSTVLVPIGNGEFMAWKARDHERAPGLGSEEDRCR